MRQQLSIRRYFPQFSGNLRRTREKTDVDQASSGEEFPPCYQDGREDPTKTVPGPRKDSFSNALRKETPRSLPAM